MIDMRPTLVYWLTKEPLDTLIEKADYSTSTEMALKEINQKRFSDRMLTIGDVTIDTVLSSPYGWNKYAIEYDILLFSNQRSITGDMSTIESIVQVLQHSKLASETTEVEQVNDSQVIEVTDWENVITGNSTNNLRYCIIRYQTTQFVSR